MRDAQAKANVLIEALPYIRRWAGSTVVVKIGGETLDDPEMLNGFATDVALMRFVGMNPVVVHGGGPQISEMMKTLGLAPRFVGGLRVTDAETMEVVKMVLLGKINREIVASLSSHAGKASGLSGEDGNLITAEKSMGPSGEDLGFVGVVKAVDPSVIDALIEKEFIPVIAPIGRGPDGSYNINADVAAGAIASAIGAAKLVFLTNVPGLYGDLGDEGSLISETSVEQLEGVLISGGASEGMVPKIRSAVDAIRAGVPQAHILDGRIAHALLLEVFTDEGIGTMVLP